MSVKQFCEHDKNPERKQLFWSCMPAKTKVATINTVTLTSVCRLMHAKHELKQKPNNYINLLLLYRRRALCQRKPRRRHGLWPYNGTCRRQWLWCRWRWRSWRRHCPASRLIRQSSVTTWHRCRQWASMARHLASTWWLVAGYRQRYKQATNASRLSRMFPRWSDGRCTHAPLTITQTWQFQHPAMYSDRQLRLFLFPT